MTLLRILIAAPAAAATAVWEWLTHDEFHEFIDDQRRRLHHMAKGE